MLFTNKNSYGVQSNIFINNYHVGYVNLSRVKTKQGVTAGSAFSVDNHKQLSIIKSYNEFLERFSLGIPIDSTKIIKSIDLEKRKIANRAYSEFGYGKHMIGFNDTTGTASGKSSEIIIQKALTELIEKNEVFCFWYGLKGRKISIDQRIIKQIDCYKFISNQFKLYVISELSNFPTVIVMGFLDKKLITTGVCCSTDINKALNLALKEAKGIEWQTFKNPLATSSHYSNLMHKRIFERVQFMDKTLKSVSNVTINKSKTLKTIDWINHIEVAVIGDDVTRGIKVIKCISKQLLNSIPIKANIEMQMEKEIVGKYLVDYSIDCPIQ